MLDQRKKIEIILAIILLIVLGIVLAVLFLKPGDGENQGNKDGSDDVTVTEPIVETTVSSRTLESPPDIIARSFVERFGSYSTDIDYANVDEVKTFATAALVNQLDTLLNGVRQSAGAATYYGVSTKVITIDMIEETETSATFAITTQRKETIDTPANTSVRYQDIEVEVTKAGNRWLVDGFTWGE